jgi:LysM repeat protein
MLRDRARPIWGVVLGVALCCGGCSPSQVRVVAERDPHFERGRSLVNGQDFKGAVEEFELAVEDNPRSAAAHFELGWLYETKVNNEAAAIYHYQRYLQLEPDSDRSRAIDVRERIRGCKQQLASAEFPLPNNQDLQREVDRLTAENLVLKGQLDAARNEAAARGNAVAPAPLPAAGVVAVAIPAAARVTAPTGRVHVVRARETLSSIAAEYRVKISAIVGVNPQVNPKRLRIGQSLNLP